MTIRTSARNLLLATALTATLLGIGVAPAVASPIIVPVKLLPPAPQGLIESSTREAIIVDSPYNQSFQQFHMAKYVAGDALETFSFVSTGGGAYEIKQVASGQCLTPDLNGPSAQGADVVQVPLCEFSDLPQFSWRLSTTQPGRIINVATGECLTASSQPLASLTESQCSWAFAPAPIGQIWGLAHGITYA